MRNGNLEFEATGTQLTWAVPQSGVYRVEAWLELAGREQIWILANPFYLKD